MKRENNSKSLSSIDDCSLVMPIGKVALDVYYCLPDRVIEDGKIKTKGGIILNDPLNERASIVEYSTHPWVAKVLSSGSDQFSVGDIVYLSGGTGHLLNSNPNAFEFIIYSGTDVMVMPESRIVCIDNKLDLTKYKKLGS